MNPVRPGCKVQYDKDGRGRRHRGGCFFFFFLLSYWASTQSAGPNVPSPSNGTPRAPTRPPANGAATSMKSVRKPSPFLPSRWGDPPTPPKPRPPPPGRPAWLPPRVGVPSVAARPWDSPRAAVMAGPCPAAAVAKSDVAGRWSPAAAARRSAASAASYGGGVRVGWKKGWAAGGGGGRGRGAGSAGVRGRRVRSWRNNITERLHAAARRWRGDVWR